MLTGSKLRRSWKQSTSWFSALFTIWILVVSYLNLIKKKKKKTNILQLRLNDSMHSQCIKALFLVDSILKWYIDISFDCGTMHIRFNDVLITYKHIAWSNITQENLSYFSTNHTVLYVLYTCHNIDVFCQKCGAIYSYYATFSEDYHEFEDSHLN